MYIFSKFPQESLSCSDQQLCKVQTRSIKTSCGDQDHRKFNDKNEAAPYLGFMIFLSLGLP